ncbi:purine-cytosine permease family protein [Brevibacillus ginsengisoli]|uniref:purine-cytosine permease family protein n=1 Tax=Brevibacillus ginsengisoli TaxID=363854 RepID=UPI003CF46B28
MSKQSVEQESVFGLLPILPKERIWGAYDYTMVNIGLAIATWCFMIGGSLSTVVDLKKGFAALMAGDTISVLFVCLAVSMPSVKFGVDQYISQRSIFGINGLKFPLFFVLLIQFGWVAILSIMFGNSASNIYSAVAHVNQPSIGIVIGFSLLALVLSWIVVAKGPVSIKWLNRIVAPGLILMLVVMMYMLFSQHSFGEILALKPSAPYDDNWKNYMVALEMSLGTGFSWWPIMGGMARLTKTQRAAFWPNMIGINLCIIIGAMTGLVSGLVVGNADPTAWMVPIGGPIIGVIALVFIAIANVTSTTAMAYSNTLALKQIKGFMHTSWGKLCFVFLAPAAPLLFFPDQIFNYAGSFLSFCGTIMGPLTGISFVDYYVLRKQRIQLAALYSDEKDKPYHYWGGTNYLAIVVLIISTLVYFLILNPITFDNSSFFLYATATMPVTILASVLYYVLTKLIIIPKGLGGYSRSTSEKLTKTF